MKIKFLTLILFILLAISSSHVNAALPWENGTVYNFNHNGKYVQKVEPLEKNQPELVEESTFSSTESLEIIDSNEDTQRIEFESLSSSSERTNSNTTINATIIGDSLLYFHIFYETDDDDRQYIEDINVVSWWLWSYFFIDPNNWDDFNDALSESLDPDKVIQVDTKGNNVTIQDVFDEAETYKIMGKKTLNDGINELTGDNKKFTLEMDFANVVSFKYFDEDTNKTRYEDFSKFLITYSIEFDNDGVLKEFKYTLTKEVTTSLAKLTFDFELTIGTGGLLGGVVGSIPGFELPLAIFSIILLPIIIKRRK